MLNPRHFSSTAEHGVAPISDVAGFVFWLLDDTSTWEFLSFAEEDDACEARREGLPGFWLQVKIGGHDYDPGTHAEEWTPMLTRMRVPLDTGRVYVKFAELPDEIGEFLGEES